MNDRPSSAEPLSSWKEIAAYLGRSVRTVRRWESTEGLPVRRHRHRKASTVFAIREEIDTWRREREEGASPALDSLEALPAPARKAEPEVEAETAASDEPTTTSDGRWPRWAAAAALVALGLVGGWFWRGAQPAVFQSAPRTINGESSDAAHLESVLRRALELDIVNGAVQLCHETPQEPDCLLLQESVAQLRPEDFQANYEAAFALAAHGADLDRAQSYAQRASALMSEHVVSDDAEAVAWILLFEARRSWAAGDAQSTIQSAERLESTLASWPPRLRNLLARDLGTLALALGRTGTAKQWFEHISDLDFRHEMLAWYLFASGQKAELMQHLAQEVTYREPFTAILLAMANQTERAEKLIDRLENERISSSHAALARGAITFFSGRHDEAAGSLEATLTHMRESGDPIFFAGSDILAMARNEQGDLPRAIEALEMTQRQRDRAMFWSAGIHWIMCQSRLAGLYKAAGQEELQRDTDREIRDRLRFADPDFPVLDHLAKRAERG